jgi:spore germination protein
MRIYKSIIFLLLITLFMGIMAPAPTLASSLTGDSGKGLVELLGDFLGNLFSNILHVNPGEPGSSGQALPTSSKATGDKDVLGFYAEWSGTDTASYDDLVKHTDAIGTIAPFWASLHGDGSLTNRGGNDHKSVVNYAKRNKITTLLMINNVNQAHPEKGIHAVLASPSLRKTAIDNIEASINQYGLDGINIDFEMVPAGDRDNLTTFIRELAARLKPQGKIVSIDVFPKHNEENDVATAYDYKQLGQYADRIILMTYDYHAGWNGPGGIADIRSVEADLKYALTMIPKNKVYLGIAGYGYDWSSQGTKDLEYGSVQKLIARFGPNVQWDNAAKSRHFSYTDENGITHQVWYEDSRSLEYKLDLVNAYDIAGIAIWKLGDEDPDSWQVIRNKLNSK